MLGHRFIINLNLFNPTKKTLAPANTFLYVFFNHGILWNRHVTVPDRRAGLRYNLNFNPRTNGKYRQPSIACNFSRNIQSKNNVSGTNLLFISIISPLKLIGCYDGVVL